MTDTGRCSGFPYETEACRLLTKVFFVDDLQCDRTLQIEVKGFVSDTHSAAA